jgi:hypothetical protein
MRRRGSVYLSIMIVLGVALSGLAISAPITTDASGARTATVGQNSAVALQSEQGQETNQSQRSEDRADRGRVAQGKVDSWRDLCSGPKSIRLAQSNLCTHGPDPAPPGLDDDQRVPALSPRTARQEMAAFPCAGDGQSGYRVQVLYVRASNVSSRYTQTLPSFRAWAGIANQIFQESAAATGGSRHLRFVHDANCLPIVTEVVVSPAGDGDFGTMITELTNMGYDRTDRIYLTFVDTTAAGICGIGTLWSDDRASEDNWNNFGPSYSRVDAGCWSGEVAAHEVMHNLGGVQDSAPNSSGGFHCIDEYDVMCYRDSSQSPNMRYDCPDQGRYETQFDCGHQDYYHTNPAAGSYLADFWNAANNQFLIGVTVDPPPPDVTDDPNDDPNKDTKNKKHKKHKKHNRKQNRH